MRRTPLPDRLWSRVIENGECWDWTGPLSSSGYGVIASGGRRSPLLRTHRVAYELMVGEIPEGLQIDHLCRNRICCNPYHMEPVTQAENLRRAGEARKHCPHGHDLPPRVPGKRRPGCPTCARIRYEKAKAIA